MMTNFFRFVFKSLGRNRSELSLKQRLIAVHINSATP